MTVTAPATSATQQPPADSSTAADAPDPFIPPGQTRNHAATQPEDADLKATPEPGPFSGLLVRGHSWGERDTRRACPCGLFSTVVIEGPTAAEEGASATACLWWLRMSSSCPAPPVPTAARSPRCRSG